MFLEAPGFASVRESGNPNSIETVGHFALKATLPSAGIGDFCVSGMGACGQGRSLGIYAAGLQRTAPQKLIPLPGVRKGAPIVIHPPKRIPLPMPVKPRHALMGMGSLTDLTDITDSSNWGYYGLGALVLWWLLKRGHSGASSALQRRRVRRAESLEQEAARLRGRRPKYA